MNSKYYFILFTIICSGFVFSQLNPKTNWGSVSEEEINFKEVPYEKEADAVILYESGEILVANRNWGNKIYKRIKILSEKGKDIANYDLVYFSLMGIESVLNLRAQTINFENGKKIITAVKTKEIYDLPYSGYYRTKRFAFPNVKVGSIIELEYEIINYYHQYLEGWVFQHKIPTLYSTFTADIQAPIDYIPIVSGDQIIEQAKNTKNLKGYKNSWTLKNLPSLEKLNFLYNPRDFEERIDFQSRGYLHQHGHYVKEVTQWKDILAYFEKDFQKVYDGKIVNDISKRISQDPNETQTFQNILTYFKTNFSWNHMTNVIPRSNYLEIDQSKKGSTSELNLVLHHLLVKKGIDSKLVLIGNREHRKIQTAYPYFNQFSSLVNLVTFKDGSSFFVDASQISDFGYRYMPLGNYNHFGLIFAKDKEEIISMSPPLSEYHISETYHFDETKINVKQIEKKSGYFNDAEISNEYQTQNALDVSLSEISKSPHVNLEDDYFSSKTQLQSENTKPGFFSFRNPLEPVLKNFLFNDPTRNKPIEFDFPVYYKILVSSKIPEGYSAQIPTDFNSQRKLGTQDLIYYQNAEIQNGNLVISIEFVIHKLIFSEKGYPEIKSFFDHANLDASKSILLKKN